MKQTILSLFLAIGWITLGMAQTGSSCTTAETVYLDSSPIQLCADQFSGPNPYYYKYTATSCGYIKLCGNVGFLQDCPGGYLPPDYVDDIDGKCDVGYFIPTGETVYFTVTAGFAGACVSVTFDAAFCTLEYNPVCGPDGTTYGNPCQAECAGVFDYTYGECPAPVICTYCENPLEGGNSTLLLCEDFEGYFTGQVTPQSNNWVTWNANAGDGIVTDNLAYELPDGDTPKSLVIDRQNQPTTDIVYQLGDEPLTSDPSQLSFKMYVPVGYTGYYNIQRSEENFISGGVYGVQFNADGTGTVDSGSDEIAEFAYEQGKWLDVIQTFEWINGRVQVTLVIDGLAIARWEYGDTQIGGINFFAVEDALYYVDKICFTTGNIICTLVYYEPPNHVVCSNGIEFDRNCYFNYGVTEFEIGECAPPCEITITENCDLLDYEYTGDGLDYHFFFRSPDPHQFELRWSVNDVIQTTQFGNEVFAYRFAESGFYKICLEYTDYNGCVYRCCKRIYVEDPYACDGIIDYEFLYNDGRGYQFSLGITEVTDISWYIGQSGDEYARIGDGPTSEFVNVPDNCGRRIVCVKYYEPASDCWKICCRAIYFCDPFDCADIIQYTFNPDNGLYRFSFNGENYDQEFGLTWINDTNGEQFGSDASEEIELPVTDGTCAEYVISVRYYDPGCNCWRICCQRICVCSEAEECNYIQYQEDTGGVLTTLVVANPGPVKWFVDNGGTYTGISDTRTAFLPYPDGLDCRVVRLCAYYLDLDDGCWKWCCRTIEVCPPPLVCDPNVCPEAIAYKFNPESGRYIFTLDVPTADPARGFTWKNETLDEQFGSDFSEEIDLPVADGACQTFTISVQYYDFSCNCWKLCCREICICRSESCQRISYQEDANGYNLFLETENVTNLTWYLDRNGELNEIGQEGTVFVAYSPEQECRNIKVCCYYFDLWDGCWKWCCREICICRPVENCNLIDFRYNPEAGGYEFEIDAPNATAWDWRLTDEFGNQDEPFGSGAVSSPIYSAGVCRAVTVCCRYFDESIGCWRICCKRVWLCNPWECADNIDVSFDTNTGLYNFTLLDGNVDVDLGLNWTLENTGEQFGSGTTESLALEAPEDGCATFYVNVRYFDIECGCYRVCRKEVCICRDAEECILATPVPVAGGIEVVLDDEAEALRSWYTGPNGEIIPFGEVVIIPYPTAEQGCYFSTVCCHYYDPVDNCWKLCCAVVEVCPPKPADCAETNCGEYIIEEFDPNTTEYVFSVTDPNVDPDQPLDWTVEQTGEQFGSGTSASIALTAPEDGCITYTIRVIYVDATTGLYKACCKEICICRDAEECILATPVPVAGGIEVVLDDEAEALRSWYTGPNGEIIPFW